MLRRSVKYTKETIQFFSIPIKILLQQQSSLLLIAVAVTESAFSSSVMTIPLFFTSVLERELAGLQLTTTLVVYYLVSLSTASYFGSISDRYGRRPLLIIGTALAAISFLPFPLVSSNYAVNSSLFLVVLLSNGIKGLGAAMIAGPILSMFADIAPERGHGETMGKFYLARSAGSASGLFLGGILWEMFGVTSFYFFMIVMFIATSLYLFRFFEPQTQDSKPYEMDFTQEATLNPFKTMIQSLQNKQFRKFAIAWLAYTTLIGAAGPFAPIILADIDIGTGMVGVILLVGVGILGLMQPTIGKLSDNIGRKPFLVIGCVGTSLLIVVIAGIITLPPSGVISIISDPFSLTKTEPLVFIPDVPIPLPHLIIILLLLIFLISASGFASSSLGLITDVTEEGNRGGEMGFTQAIMSTGSILGNIIGGSMFTIGGALGVMTFCFSLSLIAVVIIMQFIYETSGFYHFTHSVM